MAVRTALVDLGSWLGFQADPLDAPPGTAEGPLVSERAYSPESLAERWDCGETSVKKLLRDGKLAGFKIGTLWRVTSAEVERFEHGLIDLSPKDEDGDRMKGRAVVPINNTLRPALLTAYEARTTKWVIEWAGAQVATVKKGFREACIRSGVKCRPHDLRRTAAVWMAAAGVDIERIAQFLGHANPAVTRKHYAKFQPDWLQDAAKALEGA